MLAAVSIVGLALILGASAPRPEVGRGARAAVVDAADRTLEAIDRLESELAPAVEAAREGSARVVAGDEDPSERIAAAADAIRAAASSATEVRAAIADLNRARIALDPDAPLLPPAPDAAELASIADQLGDAAGAGASFAEARQRAEAVADGLVDALDSVSEGNVDEAQEQLLSGSDAVDGMRAWEDDAQALSVWIDTVDAMIRAMQRLVEAVRTNDAEAAFADASEGAAEADRALRIGLGEAGSALTSVPNVRLADALAALDEVDVAARAARAEAGG